MMVPMGNRHRFPSGAAPNFTILACLALFTGLGRRAAGRPFCIHHNELLPHSPIVETPRDRREGGPKSVRRMVAAMDELCGRIMAEVDRLGIADDTIVIFTGDNGTDMQVPRQTVAGAVAGGKRDLNDAGGLPHEVVVAEPRFADAPLARLEQAGREITSLPRTNRKDR